jgi:hypothetical protein
MQVGEQKLAEACIGKSFRFKELSALTSLWLLNLLESISIRRFSDVLRIRKLPQKFSDYLQSPLVLARTIRSKQHDLFAGETNNNISE